MCQYVCVETNHGFSWLSCMFMMHNSIFVTDRWNMSLWRLRGTPTSWFSLTAILAFLQAALGCFIKLQILLMRERWGKQGSPFRLQTSHVMLCEILCSHGIGWHAESKHSYIHDHIIKAWLVHDRSIEKFHDKLDSSFR